MTTQVRSKCAYVCEEDRPRQINRVMRALYLVLSLLYSIADSALLGTRWSIALDVGQEKGSWMPPSWGRSGSRAQATPVISFEDDGKLRLVGSGGWDHLTVKWREGDGGTVGRWNVEGEKCTFYLEHEGVSRSDVVLEPGRLYCTAGSWGDLLARRGSLTIKQKRMGWLPFLPTPNEASFMVGVFRSSRVDEDSEPGPA